MERKKKKKNAESKKIELCSVFVRSGRKEKRPLLRSLFPNSTIVIARRRGNYDTRVVVRGRWFLLRPLEESGRGCSSDPPHRSIRIFSLPSLFLSRVNPREREREREREMHGKERAEYRTKTQWKNRKTDTCRCKILVLNVYVGLRAHTRPSVNKRMSLDTRVHASPACVEARDDVSGTQREQSRSIA